MDIHKFAMIEQNIYLSTQGKSFEERIEKVVLDKNEEKKIIEEKSTKIIRDKIFGCFKIGEIVSVILNWNDEISKDFKEAKKNYLLQEYFNKVDKQEDAVNKLKNYLTHPTGFALFNKILKIIDDNPVDVQLTDILSSTLKYIIENDNFKIMFEKHKYALSQIERLSVQSLLMLSDYNNFPSFRTGAVGISGGKVTSEWVSYFAKAYCNKNGILQEEIIYRVIHTVKQLENEGYLLAQKHGDEMTCLLSNIGTELLPYIKIDSN